MKTITNKTIVLDIDECLVRSHIEDNVEDPNIMSPSNITVRSRYFEVPYGNESFWGVKRPHLDPFLAFCGRYFATIVVWSAGEKEYVQGVVRELFRDHRKPDLILTREDCIGKIEDYHKPISVLKKYISDFDPRLVIVIDDKQDNFRDNADNGISIPKFHPAAEHSFKEVDSCLPNIINWFMTEAVIKSQDITKLDKTRIFLAKKPSIASHEQYIRYPHSFFFAPREHQEYD